MFLLAHRRGTPKEQAGRTRDSLRCLSGAWLRIERVYHGFGTFELHKFWLHYENASVIASRLRNGLLRIGLLTPAGRRPSSIEACRSDSHHQRATVSKAPMVEVNDRLLSYSIAAHVSYDDYFGLWSKIVTAPRLIVSHIFAFMGLICGRGSMVEVSKYP